MKDEGNTGVESLKEEILSWVRGADRYNYNLESQSEYIANEILKRFDKENAALIAALKELIPIAEFLKNEYPIDFYLYFKESAIENAKKLI